MSAALLKSTLSKPNIIPKSNIINKLTASSNALKNHVKTPQETINEWQKCNLSNEAKVKRCYREIMRASRLAFRGDSEAERICLLKARHEFSIPFSSQSQKLSKSSKPSNVEAHENDGTLKKDGDKSEHQFEMWLDGRIKTGLEAAYILKCHTVQLHLVPTNENQNNQARNRNNNLNKNDVVYRVNIDPDRHELGDNESRFASKARTQDPCGCHTCYD